MKSPKPFRETVVLAAEDPRALECAVALLEDGQVVAIPTDTVYGLAAIAENDDAVSRIFALKDRPPDRPLPIFPVDCGQAGDVADLGAGGRALASTFWPGALTIVARRAAGFRSAALLGYETVGLRLPADDFVLALLRRVGRPLAVTSANRSGAGSVTTAAEVVDRLAGLVPLVVDGGAGSGADSTIIDITAQPARLLRAGDVPLDAVRAVLAAAAVR